MGLLTFQEVKPRKSMAHMTKDHVWQRYLLYEIHWSSRWACLTYFISHWEIEFGKAGPLWLGYYAWVLILFSLDERWLQIIWKVMSLWSSWSVACSVTWCHPSIIQPYFLSIGTRAVRSIVSWSFESLKCMLISLYHNLWHGSYAYLVACDKFVSYYNQYVLTFW